MHDFFWTSFVAEIFLLVLLGGCCYALVKLWQMLQRARTLLEDSMEIPGNGLVFFDEHEEFQKASRKAREYIPFLSAGRRQSLKLDDFLNYMYDHALDFDESLRGAINRKPGDISSQGFREVINWGDGRICLVEAQETPVGGTIFVLSDVSDLKKHEEDFIRLHEYSHELTQAIEAATIGTVISNPKTENNPVIFVNEALCKLTGLERGDIIGNDWKFLLDTLGDCDAAQSLFQALDDGEDADIEVKLTKDEKEQWFNVKLTSVKDEAGEPDLFIGVFTETTDQKQKQAENFQLQKLEALGQLAAGVAHDFNNILSIIDGYVRMADQEVEEGSKASDYLQRTRLATKRGASLTKRMLMFSRHKIVTESVIDLRQVVVAQEQLLQPLIDASINFTIRTPSEQICVECSPDAIGQILMNFVINGRDAMPNGGALIVEVTQAEEADLPAAVPLEERGKEFACLSVLDTGTGMDKETLARVFDPFFTTKEQGKGTGLGLSMVYGLVQEMGGYINITSSLGRGTKMSVYLPFTDKEPSKTVVGTEGDIKNLHLKGYTALVAEDEPDLRELVSDMLEKLGMTVLQAGNGNEALALQEDYQGDIDILLTDVVMPELNGVKLAELFQSLREETKVVFMSGYPAGGQMARVELPEDAYFMAKPIAYDALAQLIYQRVREQGATDIDDESGISSARWQTGSPLEQ